MFNYSNLKYPPLKPQKLPDYLMYRNYAVESINDSNTRIYNAISTKTGELCGRVSYSKESILHQGKRINSLYVEDLRAYKPNQGVGTTLLNFIRTLSYNYGFGGNFHLRASGTLKPSRIPHIFYRKYGMTTGRKSLDAKMDEFIKEGKDATYKDFDCILMYYTPEAPQKPKIKAKDATKYIKRFLRTILTKYGEYSRNKAMQRIKFI